MPPRAKFTKEHIAQVAFDLVRQDGINALTARNLGKHLGSSYCPIFTLFENMQEVQDAVLAKANALYNRYIAEGLNQEVAFIGVGKQFIKFAMDEPQLFQIMFMQRDCVIDFEQYIPDTRENYPLVMKSLTQPYGLTDEQAERVYQHLVIYTLGIGMLCSRKVCMFTDEQVVNLFTEVFHSLLKEIKA